MDEIKRSERLKLLCEEFEEEDHSDHTDEEEEKDINHHHHEDDIRQNPVTKELWDKFAT